jgi:zona occludens toxin (predicted ATPase)
VKKDNNNNSANLNEFKITFLIAIFAMILITSTLTLNNAAVFAQSNFEEAVKKQANVQTQNILDNETALLAKYNITNSLQSDNQTGVGQNQYSNSPQFSYQMQPNK